LVLDGFGNLYIGDSGAGRVRKVSPDGIITTVAGGLGRNAYQTVGNATADLTAWF
jgi:hypothetical protein